MNDYLQIALEHYQAGRLAETENVCRQILAGNPNDPAALHLLGLVAYRAGHNEAACDLIRRAIGLAPAAAEYHNNLSVVLEGMGRYDEALAAARQSINLQPNSAGAWYNLANALRRKRKLEEALAAYQHSLGLDPGQIDARGNYASTLKLLGRRGEAIAEFQAVVNAAPGDIKALNNLGDALRDDGQIEAAIAVQRRALGIDPHNGGAHNNLGTALVRRALAGESTGDFERAIDEFHQSIVCDPRNSEARMNLGMTYLLLGDFERGWQYYEGRQRLNTASGPVNSSQPWEGRDIAGKTIVLHHEQGLGDTIQFIRYAPLIVRRGASVIVACPRPLHRLLKCVAGVKQLIAEGEPVPPHDVHCRLPSLPFVFQTRLDTIPAERAYVFAEREAVEQWGRRMGSGNRKKIGLVWAGNPRHANDHNRSILLEQLAPLAELGEGVQFFSLQKGPAAAQVQNPPRGMSIIDWTNDLHDFADTAALIANLDLVIAADTAVAHVSAAMGRATWLLLSNVPDWRWMLGRSDSPWYPTVRLFRQRPGGGWETPIQDILLELRPP